MIGEDAAGRRDVCGWSIRWNADLAAKWRAEGWWLDRTVGDAARERAAMDPDRVLIVDHDRCVTAAELYHDAVRLADAMWRDGLRAGDVASFMLPNWHEACCIYLAASILGLVVHPLVPAYRRSEVAFMLMDCRSRIVFVPARFRGFDYSAMMADVCADLNPAPKVVVVRGEGDDGEFASYETYLAGGAPGRRFEDVDPDSVRMILYTSGTTGRPKGVLHTHNSINADIVQIERHWNGGQAARYLVASPVSHIGGSLYAFELPILFGTSAVLLDVWDPDLAVTLIDREGCSHTAGATPFLEQLLAAAKAAGSRLDTLRVFICGGASVSPSLVRDATAWFSGCAVSRVYGSTEVPTITIGSVAPGDGEHAAETDGRIGIADVRLVDAGLSGGSQEIVARGPQMLVGYNRAEDEIEAFDKEGFFRMGDLGVLVDQAYLVISGRKKDIIIRHGENISPKEVEDILILHPDVADVALIGLPSQRTGELACAIVVPREGAAFSVADARDFLGRQGVARFKFPERIILRDALPRNATGKILKHVLKADALAADAGGPDIQEARRI